MLLYSWFLTTYFMYFLGGNDSSSNQKRVVYVQEALVLK